ncbi:MAG: HPr family phosphocarrier protein [Defluviitaleaceae bacterium]|nr:HPr family phosphocarrier protein [Defluviitaleaceae bacterium]
MKQKTIKVSASLEARTAALFVQTAGKFQSTVKIRINDKEANAKSIMGMISLGLLEGNTITITTEGPDEDKALSESCNFFITG